MLIDVHSHLLPFVDDGSDSLDSSIEIIKKLELEGVSKIILTPHYKHGVYKTTKAELKIEFDKFCTEVKNRGVNVELYLGQEVFCDEKNIHVTKK